MIAEVTHKGLELVAAYDGGARPGGIDEPGGDGAAVFDSPAFDGLALLVGGEFLAVAAGIAKVGGVGVEDVFHNL